MEITIRVCVTVVVAVGLAAGMWIGLQYAGHIDVAVASGAAGALFTGLTTVGAVLTLPAGAARSAERDPIRRTITLNGVTNIFADRSSEWTAIRDMVREATKQKHTQAAIMIHGMPGVGKTEFARYAALRFVKEYSHRARRAGAGVLACEVDLKGFESVTRTKPEDALRELLGSDAIDQRRSVMTLDELSREWLKHLQEKFLILVLDNAADEGQVRPFLPGESQYIVLVTGRHMLTGPIDRLESFPLGVLDAPGARQMMRNMVRRKLPLEDSDQEAMDRIAEICDYLPKAIKGATAKVARRSYFSFADKLAELEASPNLLLAIDEYTHEESGGVAKSFETSYMQLSDDAKLVLRRMALSPVPVVNTEAATALAGLPAEVVSVSLDEMVDETLIEEHERDGYQMHDLVLHYARSLAGRDDPGDNAEAIDRLLAYYWGAAAYGDSIFTRQPPPQAIEPPAVTVSHVFSDRPSAIAWVRAELRNLLACVDYVVEQANDAGRRQDQVWVVLFAGALAGLLRNEGSWPRSIDLQTQALRMAEQLHVPLAAANALSERAFLFRLAGELQAAVADLERAIAIYRQVGGVTGKTGEAHALDTYGVVLDQLKKRDEGRRRLSQALDIYRALNDRLGAANVLHDQGMLELFADNADEAVRLLGQSLTIYTEVDQPLGMAHALSNLARAQQKTGADRRAADNLETARMLYSDLGNLLGKVNTLIRLGAVLRRNDRRRAKKAVNDAMSLSIAIGNPAGRVNALDELGELHLAKRKRKAALRAWGQALSLASQYGLEREEDKLKDKIGRVR